MQGGYTFYMKEIYRASGTVNKGFIGQIAYTVCLDSVYTEMDVHLHFEKNRVQEQTPELKEEIKTQIKQKYGTDITEGELNRILKEMKTEIQLTVFMNDRFVGSIHKQLTDRHMYISPSAATEGAIAQKSIEGVIKVLVIFFNVLYDDTPYSVSVSVK